MFAKSQVADWVLEESFSDYVFVITFVIYVNNGFLYLALGLLPIDLLSLQYTFHAIVCQMSIWCATSSDLGKL